MSTVEVTVWSAWLVASLLLLVGLKVFVPQTLAKAPLRPSDFSVPFAGGIFLLYIGALIFGQVGLLSIRGPAVREAGTMAATATAAATTATSMGAEGSVQRSMESGIVMAVVGLAMVAVLIVLARKMVVGGLKAWGLGLTGVPKGLGWGLLGFVVIYPWLVLVSVAMEEVLNRHLTLHPTLKVLKESMPLNAKLVLVLGAAVVAPLVEEVLYRGVVQTSLVQRGWGMSLLAGPGAWYRPSAWQRWGAIALTSAVFSGMHWMPDQFLTLFVLAVAMGYLYERTGNLWSSITLHALFNGVNLTAFLWFKGAR